MAAKIIRSTKVNDKIVSFDKSEDEMIVYHYTSQDVLCKLFKSIKEEGINKDSRLDFWATGIMYLNDDTEYIFFENKLRSDLERYIEEYHADEIGLLENFPHIFLKEFFIPPSIISLSENGDNLSMWKMYGNNAKGVCIGFSMSKLQETLTVEECTYTSFEEKYFDNDYLEKIYTYLRGCSIGDNRIIPYVDAIREFPNTFLTKSRDYEYEKEWRIYQESEKYDFFVKDDIIKPHITVEIPLSCMRSITLGPNLKHKEVSLHALRLFIETMIGQKNASEIECKLSKSSYRDI